MVAPVAGAILVTGEVRMENAKAQKPTGPARNTAVHGQIGRDRHMHARQETPIQGPL